MSGDIVERLRRGDWRAFADERVVGLGCEAADEIERLRTLITEWYASLCEQTKLHLTNDTEQLCLAMYRHDLAVTALVKEAYREQ